MSSDLIDKLYTLPGIIIGLTLHEYAHAWTAFRLGDTTAREEGRLTLNPLRHIDPIGFIFLLVAGFGWAKPVHFDRERLAHKRRDESLIALAGPAANLVVGFLFAVLLRVLVPVLGRSTAGSIAANLMLYTVFINYGLFIFNLIPIPPLDGSHPFFSALRLKPETEAAIIRYGSIGLLAVILLGNFTKIDLLPIGKLVSAMVRATFALLGLS